jgi:hypothetical protein
MRIPRNQNSRAAIRIPKSEFPDTMTREEFRKTLLSLDLSKRQEEQPHRQRMLELLDSGVDCFRRDVFPAHFTGSALVVSADGARCLLHHHRKLDRWLQFGGHCDGEEDVLSVAQREAFEESGIGGLIVASMTCTTCTSAPSVSWSAWCSPPRPRARRTPAPAGCCSR